MVTGHRPASGLPVVLFSSVSPLSPWNSFHGKRGPGIGKVSLLWEGPGIWTNRSGTQHYWSLVRVLVPEGLITGRETG